VSSNTYTIVVMISQEAQLRDIERRVAEASGALNAAHARIVELTAELSVTGVWRGYGIRSLEHWLTLKAGLSPSRARQIVEVADVSEQLRATTRSFGDGELSFERHSPAGFWLDSFDYERLTADVLKPLGPGGDRMFRPVSRDATAQSGHPHQKEAAIKR
jgi:hypothetical protein